eukprot:tig00021072_g17985.t1
MPTSGSAACSAAAGVAPVGLGELPDELLERVLELLGAPGAFLLRPVSRRFRRAAERAAWPSLAVNAARRGESLDRSEGRMASATALLRAGRLRLTPGASAKLRAGGALPAAAPGEAERAAVIDATLGCWALRPRALAALRPAAAAGDGAGADRLVSLALWATPGDASWDPAGPEAAELGALLSPFTGLRRLSLPRDCPLGPAAAAALAAALPSLASLRCSFASDSAVGALAPLAALEELLVQDLHLEIGGAYGAGLAALAEGPAGASLRTFRTYTPDPRHDDCGDGDMTDDLHDPPFTSAGLAGLSRLPRLQNLHGWLDLRDAAPEAIAALGGGLPSLRSLSVRARGPDQVRALAAALHACSWPLERLALSIPLPKAVSAADHAAHAIDDGTLLELVREARRSPSFSLSLASCRPLGAALAGALAEPATRGRLASLRVQAPRAEGRAARAAEAAALAVLSALPSAEVTLL